MIISDLEHLEVVSSETSVEGGIAFSDAYSGAYANGSYFASTYTFTDTFASAGYGYYYYGNSASSTSVSSSAAA